MKLIWLYRIGMTLLIFILLLILLHIQSFWLPVLKGIITVLTPFIVAAFISYLLHPIVEKLHKKGLHRGFATFIIYVLFFGAIGLGVYKVSPAFVHQLKDFSKNVPEMTQQYKDFAQDIQRETSNWPMEMKKRFYEGANQVESMLDHFLDRSLQLLLKIGNFIFIILLIPFISFYMLKDFDKIKRVCSQMTPYKWRREGQQFMKDIDQSLGQYIRGQLIVCVAIGLISFLLFWFIDLKYALLLGIIVGLTNVIPYFGPFFGAIPAVIIAALSSGQMVIYVVIIIVVLQFIEGNILSPYIVGKSLHLHPLLIIAALLTGSEIGGIVGLLLAVPILAIVKVTVWHVKLRFIDKIRV